ncbi:hypothetical protein [Nocardia jejuensis]|uniref:hypothetical protein n=1 Tax=Nocardia jejuensis TaxID=328049 RepID=UPI001FE01FD5|nr:hypothetical protein [Nocardia jejuensis]
MPTFEASKLSAGYACTPADLPKALAESLPRLLDRVGHREDIVRSYSSKGIA